MKHVPALLIVTMWILVLAGPTCDAQVVESSPTVDEFAVRRVVLLSCDTLSAPELTAWGGEFENSATIDSLAQWGTLFRNCLTPIGWTLPAHMSMLTGLSPGVHRVGADRPLADAIDWLPEILADNGFNCGAFVGANGWMSPIFGFDRGFSVYESLPREAPAISWGGRWLPDNLQTESGALQPFFLLLHYMDVHSTQPSFDYLFPYWSTHSIVHYYFGLPEPPPPQQLVPDTGQWDMPAYDPEMLRRAYNACIYSWDLYNLGKVMTELRRHTLEFDTLVIVTADHGEEFGQHGSWLHDSPYGGVRHVPLLICCPGLLPMGRIVETPVSLMDIAPTILDLAQLPPMPDCQGLSLRPLLEDKGEFFPSRDFLMDGIRRGEELLDSALVARVDGTWWSLIAETDTTAGLGEFAPVQVGDLIALYNLDDDPSEKNNLLGLRPDIGETLRTRLQDAWRQDAEAAAALHTDIDGATLEIPEDMKRDLKALGY